MYPSVGPTADFHLSRGSRTLIDGFPRVFSGIGDDGTQSLFCTQQMLVNNLLRDLVDVTAADIRFEVVDVTIRNEKKERPQVSYTDQSGQHQIVCEYMAGCDADRGVSRSSIPEELLTKYSYEYGYAWLAALVEASVTGYPIMAISEHGFAAQLPRGPQRSRYYLQCALSDHAANFQAVILFFELACFKVNLRSFSVPVIIIRNEAG